MTSYEGQVLQFLGVRTAGSSALKLFPNWAEALGIDGALIEGVDIDLDSDPQIYRDRLQAIIDNDHVRGALVTSHKLNVISAAGDLFDERSEPSEICSEVSCIYKVEDKLFAHAPDAECALRVQNLMLGEDYWGRHPDAQLLLIGSGGASAALVLAQTLSGNALPAEIKVVDINQSRLDHISQIADKLDKNIKLTCLLHQKALENDALVEALPAHSIIVNATGMGKDLPGSPITDACNFPEGSLAWELNYRGPRLFMEQAGRSASRVEDGWDLFVMNWYTVIATVFGLELTEEGFESFKIASKV